MDVDESETSAESDVDGELCRGDTNCVHWFDGKHDDLFQYRDPISSKVIRQFERDPTSSNGQLKLTKITNEIHFPSY